jgi:peptidoglycan/LPS O-acetylase OafA/YrhL
MGLLRIYLALCIVAAHSGENILPWPMHTSVEAVQIFFMISGFYMSLISTKYKAAVEFYTSRFLRIFVPYYVIFILAILAMLVTGWASGNWLQLAPYLSYSRTQNGLLGVLFTAGSNLTVFFQDWVMFLKHDPGASFAFTPDFGADHAPLWNYLILPQAWSVGVELTFYLFVPLLARLRTRWLGLIALGSLAARIYAYQVLGLTNDPFNYRFFPFELLLFVTGMLAQRFYAQTLGRRSGFRLQRLPYYLVFAAVLLGSLYVSAKVPHLLLGLGVARRYTDLVSYIGWAAAIPALYHLTSSFKVDRFIGELSYPIYLIHYTVVEIVNLVFQHYSIPQAPLGLVSGMISVALAALLYTTMFRPFEERRQELVQALLRSMKWQARPLPVTAGEPPETGAPDAGRSV